MVWKRLAGALLLLGTPHGVGHIYPVAPDFERSGLDTRHIEQILDKAREAPRLFFNRGKQILPILRRHLVAEFSQTRDCPVIEASGVLRS